MVSEALQNSTVREATVLQACGSSFQAGWHILHGAVAKERGNPVAEILPRVSVC